MNNKGVSLVELLIVIVVMGVLSAFSTVAANEIIDNVRQGGFVENGETFLNAAKQAYYMGSDIWDDDEATLQELIDDGYIESISNDPWGKAYDMDATLFTKEEVDAATPNSIYISSITLDTSNRYSGQNLIFEGVVVSGTATMGFREEGALSDFEKSDIDFLNGSTNIVKEVIDSIGGAPDDDSDNEAQDDTSNDDASNDNTDNESNSEDTNNDNDNNDDTDDEEDGNYTSSNDTKTIDAKLNSPIYALGGNDKITVNGKVDNNVTIDLGDGNDQLTVNKNVNKLTIIGGTGNDTIKFTNDVKNSSISTGDGNDTVSIEEIENKATVSTGDGNDDIFIRNIAKNYKGSITLGSGNDYFRTDESSFNKMSGTIDGGEGKDTLYLLNVSYEDWNKTISKYFSGFERIVLEDTTIG